MTPKGVTVITSILEIRTIVRQVEAELLRAIRLHPRSMCSYHDGHGVIREELDEMWEEVRRKAPDKMKLTEEAIQIAAMACRFVLDLTLEEGRLQ